MRNRCSTEPAAAEDDVAVIENGGLAGGDGALRGVERDARDGGVQRLDGGGGGVGLMGGFFGSAKGGRMVFRGNSIYSLPFPYTVFASHSPPPPHPALSP